MNVYNAIMRAADQIEMQPHTFNFLNFCIPSPCGSPGCALGWIGFYAGMKPEIYGATTRVPSRILGLPDWMGDSVFYERMEALVPRWRHEAGRCAKALRLYAKKYHGHEEVVIPDWNAIASRQTVGEHERSQEVLA